MKKRIGLKSILTLLLALGLIICASVYFNAGSAKADTVNTTINVTYDYTRAKEVLDIVNKERANNGLSALKLDKNLTDTAMLRAAETTVLFSHTRPNGKDWNTAFPSTVGIGSEGENIAAGQSTAAIVMNSWMNSSGHRANILDSDFKYIGIGCVIYNGTYRYYWAQNFASAMNPYVAETRTGQVKGTAIIEKTVENSTTGSNTTGSNTTGNTTQELNKYSPVFNAVYYLNKYPDLKAAFGEDETAALNHFLNYGMKEGRQGSADFNVNSYRLEYADLRAAFGNDLKSYYLHYINYGKNEGRHGTGCTTLQGAVTSYNGVDYSKVYDYNYYVSANPDIKNAFGTDDVAVLRHFVNNGMNEGRRASASFDVNSYRLEYGDLRAAFGSNMKNYYLHYINYGKNEGRHGTGCTTLQGTVTVYNGIDYSKVYDYNYYINANPDIRAAFGENDTAVLKHFVEYGMNEGRIASSNFNVNIYKNKYSDLQQAFGSNLRSYYMHYIAYGAAEGRTAY